MIPVVIGVCVFVGFVVYGVFEAVGWLRGSGIGSYKKRAVYAFSMPTFVGVFAGLAAFFVSMVFGSLVTEGDGPQVKISEYSLAALSSGSEVDGSFFLGSGYVDEDRMFTYIIERSDGGYVLRSVEANDSVIYQIDDDNIRVEVFDIYSDPNWSRIPWNTEYHFYIPEGSILENYTVRTDS